MTGFIHCPVTETPPPSILSAHMAGWKEKRRTKKPKTYPFIYIHQQKKKNQKENNDDDDDLLISNSFDIYIQVTGGLEVSLTWIVGCDTISRFSYRDLISILITLAVRGSASRTLRGKDDSGFCSWLPNRQNWAYWGAGVSAAR